MPLVAHNNLPAFAKLQSEGIRVLDPAAAQQQDIRELHIGLLNMMPDAALEATERQFLRLIGKSNPIAQFYIHPFTVNSLERGVEARQYIDQYYENFEDLQQQGLDALIITGANITQPALSKEPFWNELIAVVDWANQNVTSTLCSCLATHAVLEFQYKQLRNKLDVKKWGVFKHDITMQEHPLMRDINTHFDVPQSRWNSVYPEQFEQAGLKILVTGNDDFVHMATSSDGFRSVFFQGHPEYDTISLLKEYKREVNTYLAGNGERPPFPERYFGDFTKAVIDEYYLRLDKARASNKPAPKFPEELILPNLRNTWHDTGCAVFGNWIGLIYQLTHRERQIPFMDHIDPEFPLASLGWNG
ncbi:MAG: homoserine O-succinyltransferase [Gammaproteobacteria bacterium]|jgi:homoserine O-succinyltransferase